MLRLKIGFAFVAAVLALQARSAFAWNFEGHLVSACIAYQQLTPEQKTAIAALLRQHPHYKSYLLIGAPDDPAQRDEYVFMKASTWPDAVRPPFGGHKPLIMDPDENQANVTKYNHGEWHYIDKMFVLPSDTADAAEDGKEPPAPNGDALSCIKQSIDTLKSATAKPADKAISLCWLLHVLGDIHQPLHCTTLITPDLPAPEGDRGGNSVYLSTPEGHFNLHAYWDNLLGSIDMQNFSLRDLPQIEFLAQSLMNEQKKDSLPMLHDHTTVESWIEESYQIARQQVYLNGNLFPAGWTKSTIIILPPDYPKNASAIAHQRIVLAGYRIADTLSAVLSHAPETQAATEAGTQPVTESTTTK